MIECKSNRTNGDTRKYGLKIGIKYNWGEIKGLYHEKIIKIIFIYSGNDYQDFI